MLFNKAQAEYWLERAAHQEYAPAQLLLGEMYGDLFEYDRAEKSAKQGDAFGMHVLSKVYNDKRFDV